MKLVVRFSVAVLKAPPVKWKIATTGWIVVAGCLMGQGAQAVDLPRGEPPKPAPKRINVAEFGAELKDDEHDDTAAVNAAIQAASNNTTLYFPAGTYNVRSVDFIKNFDGLSVQGDGPGKSIVKRMGPYWKDGAAETFENLQANFTTDCKVLHFEDCRNLCIRDIAFDAHGTPTFGGVGLYRPERLHITNTRFFDSREQPPLFGRDRFAFVIMGYEQGARDIWFVNNVVEGLQAEIDAVSRVLVERSVFKRPVKSSGISFVSANFGAGDSLPGHPITHVTVRQNYFSNGDDVGMGMLTFQLDPPSNINSRFANIDILDNVFVYDIDSKATSCAIKMGAGNSGLQTTGNVFEEFRIENNRIYRGPNVKLNEGFNGYIWFNCWAGQERLNDSQVRGNRLLANNPSLALVNIHRDNQCNRLVVEDNEVEPFQEPPTAEDFLKSLAAGPEGDQDR